MPGENCFALDNVLIVQETTVETVPEASFEGGMITFEFSPDNEAQLIYEVGLINIEEGGATISVVYDGGQTKDISVTGLGRNAVQTVPVNLENVSTLKITLTGPGAVTSIYGCFKPGTRPPTTDSRAPTPAPSLEEGTPLPTEEPATPPSQGPPSPTPQGPAPTPQGPAPTPIDGCVETSVTFDTLADGTELPGGLYVYDEWLESYGITLSAMGGSGDRPRLFNTSDFGDGTSTNYALGSPNNRCNPPGLGRGLFGQVSCERMLIYLCLCTDGLSHIFSLDLSV